MKNIIVEYGDTFDKGFIPKKGQDIYAKCPKCGYLQKIQLGQGKVFKTDLCPNCHCDIGNYFYTDEIFECTDVYFICSDEKYLNDISQYKNLNKDEDLVIKLSKFLGEVYFVDIYWIYNPSVLNIQDYIEKYPDDYFLINNKDIEAIAYLTYNKIDKHKFLMIDENRTISRINDIDVIIK